MSESQIEKSSCALLTRAYSCLCIKTKIRGYPDRQICFSPGRYFWIEFKTPTGVLSPIQKAVRKKLESRGDHYYVCRSKNEVLIALTEQKRLAARPG